MIFVEISAGLLIMNPKGLGRVIPIRVSQPTVAVVGTVEKRETDCLDHKRQPCKGHQLQNMKWITN